MAGPIKLIIVAMATKTTTIVQKILNFLEFLFIIYSYVSKKT
jgi:hypothetical protein